MEISEGYLAGSMHIQELARRVGAATVQHQTFDETVQGLAHVRFAPEEGPLRHRRHVETPHFSPRTLRRLHAGQHTATAWGREAVLRDADFDRHDIGRPVELQGDELVPGLPARALPTSRSCARPCRRTQARREARLVLRGAAHNGEVHMDLACRPMAADVLGLALGTRCEEVLDLRGGVRRDHRGAICQPRGRRAEQILRALYCLAPLHARRRQLGVCLGLGAFETRAGPSAVEVADSPRRRFLDGLDRIEVHEVVIEIGRARHGDGGSMASRRGRRTAPGP
mmetsp:Transcript_69707/g.202298  ORF Transcript_69707/g.202298 Transcript_69707/m.202298 type:complete len:283 (+) Transcript_69707:799-1647(+)